MALDTQSAAAIQQLIRDRFDATAEVATRKKLLPILRQAEKELEARLAKAAASGQPFTAAQASAYRVQIRSTVAALSKHVGEAVGDLSGEASAESVHSLMTQMKMAQAALGASPAPEVALSLPEIARLSGAFGQNTSLLKHFLDRGNASALNYGKDLIGDFEGLIAKGLATGKTTDQVSTELLTANTGFKGAWWKAERIARTEVSYAYNVTAREGSKKLGEAFPDVLNRWVEYVDDDSRLGLDDRVGDDSLRLHGQLRRPGQPFHDVVNKRDVTEPPNRPNDRAALTVWRASWGEPPGGLDRLDRESQEAFGEALAAYEAWQKARTEEEERLREEERKKEEDAAKPEEYKIHPKAAYPLTGKFAAVRFPVSEQKAAEINAAYESLVSGKVAETTAEKEVQEALDYFTKELSGARYARDPTQLDPGPERDLAEKCNRIISVLAKRDLEEPTTLYRGIWAGERRALHVPGAIIDLGPGASFSTNPLTVNLFAGQRSGVIYVWEDCVQGADIAKISSRAENEILAGGAVEILSTEVDHAGRLICRVRRAAAEGLAKAAEEAAQAAVVVEQRALSQTALPPPVKIRSQLEKINALRAQDDAFSEEYRRTRVVDPARDALRAEIRLAEQELWDLEASNPVAFVREVARGESFPEAEWRSLERMKLLRARRMKEELEGPTVDLQSVLNNEAEPLLKALGELPPHDSRDGYISKAALDAVFDAAGVGRLATPIATGADAIDAFSQLASKALGRMAPELLDDTGRLAVRLSSGEGTFSAVPSVKWPAGMITADGSVNIIVVLHELGHALEAHLPGLQRQALAIIKREEARFKRANPGIKARAKDHRDKGQKSKFHLGDYFGGTYAGKTYGDGETEIVSMALESVIRGRVPTSQAGREAVGLLMRALKGDSL